MAGRQRRGFYSSFQYVTLISGQLIALAVLLVLQASMSEPALESWGWRIPFAIGALLAVVVFYLRRRLAETESFRNAKVSEAPRSSGWTLFRKHPREALLVMALTAGGTLAFYAYTTYMQKFLVNTMFGGTAEYLALWLKDAGIERAFYWYVTAMIGLSLIVYARMRDTREHSRILED